MNPKNPRPRISPTALMAVAIAGILLSGPSPVPAMATGEVDVALVPPSVQVSQSDPFAVESTDTCTQSVQADMQVLPGDILAEDGPCCQCGDPDGGPQIPCECDNAPCDCMVTADNKCRCDCPGDSQPKPCRPCTPGCWCKMVPGMTPVTDFAVEAEEY